MICPSQEVHSLIVRIQTEEAGVIPKPGVWWTAKSGASGAPMKKRR